MRIEHNCSLEPYNSYAIKAVCARAYFPDTEEELIDLLESEKNLIFLGSGHNVILSKSFYTAHFVILNGNFDTFVFDTQSKIIRAQSGVNLLELSQFAQKNGLTGLEMFYDIPSSVGGAVIMNAGAGGIEIKDFLVGVAYYDLNQRSRHYIKRENLEFTYRNSLFQNQTHLIILKVDLQLKPGDTQQIESEMQRIKTARWKKQPRDFPNAGSVFKRPEGYYVGAIMDDLKLKGTRVGGAQISEKHGGFIVNTGNASGADVLSLIDLVQERVKKHYGFTLEVEQRII